MNDGKMTDGKMTDGDMTDQTTVKNVQETQNQYLKIGMTIFAILLVILFISLGLLKAFKDRYNTLTKCKFLLMLLLNLYIFFSFCSNN